MTKHGAATATKLRNEVYEVVVTLPSGRTVSGTAKRRLVVDDLPEWTLSPNIRRLAPNLIKNVARALAGEHDAHE